MADSADGKTIKASYVFLDTEVFIEANFNYNSHRFTSLADLAASGRIRVFLTEITLREIKANLREAIDRAATTRPHPILRNSSLPAVERLFESLDSNAIEVELLTQLLNFLKRAEVNVLAIEGDILAQVLDDYFSGVPPFGSGKNKAEFPDALALAALKQWSQAQGHALAIVTRDDGVRAACYAEDSLYHFEDLAKYLDAVSSENETLAAFIREMIPLHNEKIFDKAKEAFPQLGFVLTDQDGDVDEVELTSIDLDEDVEIISLTPNQAIVELPASLTFKADVTYDEPGTGTYDSEDRVMLFQDTVDETVERTAHRSIGVEVTFEDLDPDSFQVHGVWFEGSQDIDVESDFDKDWPYK